MKKNEFESCIISELEEKIKQIPDIVNKNKDKVFAYDDWNFKSWFNSVSRLLERLTNDSDSPYVTDFSNIRFKPERINFASRQDFMEAFQNGINEALLTLTNIIEEIKKYWVPKKIQQKNDNMWNVHVTNNLNQTSIIDIQNNLKTILNYEQYINLHEILQEKNEKTKWEKLLDFLKDLWSDTLAKLIKDILLWI